MTLILHRVEGWEFEEIEDPFLAHSNNNDRAEGDGRVRPSAPGRLATPELTTLLGARTKTKRRGGPHPDAKDRTALLVLGGHRSGTSALTRMLSIAGARLPATLMGAADSNEKGHWESESLVACHDALLTQLSSSWDDWQELDLNRVSLKDRQAAKTEIATQVDREYSDAALFAVKDPRICRFVPFFRDALSELNCNIRVALPFRNPLEVIASLRARNGMGRTDAALLWLRHVLEAELGSRDLPRVVLSYDALLNDWQTIYERLEAEAGVNWPFAANEISDQITKFLDPTSRHHARTTEEVLLDPKLSNWVAEVYQAMLVLEQSPNSNAACAKLDDIHREFNQASPVLRQMRDDVYSSWAKESEKQKAELKEQGTKAGQLEANIDQKESELSDLAADLASSETRANELAKKLQQKHIELNDLSSVKTKIEVRAEQRGAFLAQKNKELDALRTAQLTAKSEIERLHSSLAEKQKLVEDGRIAQLQVEEGSGQIAASLAAKEVEYERSISANGKIGQRISWLRAQVKRGNTDLSVINEALNLSKRDSRNNLARFEQKVTEHSQLRAQFLRLKADGINLSARLEKSDSKLTITSQELDISRGKARKLERAEIERGTALSAINSANERIEQLNSILHEKDSTLAELYLENSDVRTRAEAFSAEISAKHLEFERLQELHSRAEDDRQRYKTGLKESAAEIAHLTDTVVGRSNKLADALQSREIVRNEAEQLQRDLSRYEKLLQWHETGRSEFKGYIYEQIEKDIHLSKKIYIDNLHYIKLQKMFPWTRRAYYLIEEKIILASGLFDALYYESTYGNSYSGQLSAVSHFVRHGSKNKCNPNSMFDTDFYVQTNLDGEETALNPLIHYIVSGAESGLKPHPYFPDNYKNNTLDVSKINPLRHYLAYNRGDSNPNTDLPDGDVNTRWLARVGDVNYSALRSIFEHFGLRGRIDWKAPGDIEAHRAPEYVQFINTLADNYSAPTGNCDVSIVIATYKELRYSLACIASLLVSPTRYSFEIIVADDGSPDGSADILSQIDGVRLLADKENVGFLRNCNRAADTAIGKYIVMLNNDTMVLPGWLDELIGTLERDEQVGLVGSKLLFPDGKLQEAGGIIWQDGSGWNFGRLGNAGAPEFNYARDVDYCSGASIALRRLDWIELGGFDEHFAPAYYEDTDLAFRVRGAGKRVLYQPLSEIIHFEGISSGTDLSSGVKRFQVENKVKFIESWFSALESHGSSEAPPGLFFNRPVKGKALLIDERTPEPDMDSGSVDTFNTLKIFKNLGYETVFIPRNMAHVGRYTTDLQRLGVKTVYAPSHNGSIIDAAIAEAADADVILIYRVTMASDLLDLIKEAAPETAVIVFNTVDLHFLREKRAAKISKSTVGRRKAMKTRTAELAAMRKSDATILLSEHEVEVIQDIDPKINTYRIPIMRDVPGRGDTNFEQRSDVVFLGGFEHTPNGDAVEYFAREVWPLVAARKSGAKFIIAGSKMPQEIKDLASEDIVIRGFVEDLPELFNSCRMTVAPLRFGAGLKGKVISSLSHGVPVVATPIAAEGSGLKHGTHLLIGDSAEEMAQAIDRCYSDPDLWNHLSVHGLQFCEENFSINTVTRLLGDLIAGTKKQTRP